MTKKEIFLSYIDKLIDNDIDEKIFKSYNEEEQQAISSYLNALVETDTSKPDKPALTDNGKLILQFLQGEDEKFFKAKDIADSIAVSSRMVSGAIRKLCSDGFVEKMGKDPVLYQITEKGKNFEIKN